MNALDVASPSLAEPAATSLPERALTFPCAGEHLVGVLSPSRAARSDVGVVVIVGGPQYRAGSHRQFALLARRLASAGYPSLRFDVRGMGDASGDFPGFESVGLDIAAAAQALRAEVPEVRRVVLWGLCDAASAALMEADGLPSIAGIVACNPWVRHADTYARTEVKKYYAQKLFDRAFWRKLLSGQVAVGTAAVELTQKVGRMLRSYARPAGGGAGADTGAPRDFRERVVSGMLAFTGPQLFLLSGRDHTCAEFLEFAGSHPALADAWARPGITRIDMADADHTFSSAALRRAAEDATLDWLEQRIVG